MPNGNPNFDLEEQEAWFGPISETIAEFARSRNLFLEKYYHENCSWDLRFNHPRGGRGAVTVYNGGSDLARIGSTWYLDDYDRFTRFIHWRGLREIPKSPDAVRRELAIELAAILSVPVGQWTQVATAYASIWGQYTKEEFQRMTRQYPYPLV